MRQWSRFSKHIGGLRTADRNAGRDSSRLEVAAMPLRSGQTVAQTLTCVPEMVEARVNVFRFGTARCKSVDEMFGFIDELSEAFSPYRTAQVKAESV